MKLQDNRTEEQKSALRLAAIAGYFKDLAMMRGGTGELRKPLSKKKRDKKKVHRMMQRESRRKNRGVR